MRIIHILFLGAVLFFSACQNQGAEKTSANGFQYVLHTNTGNPIPQAGEYVYFHAQMRTGDSVLYSSRASGQTPFLQIPTEEQPGRKPSPVEDVLKEIGEGDSVSIVINIDTMKQKPPGLEDVSEVMYDVVSIDIMSEEEYQTAAQKRNQEEMAKREAVQAREAEVQAQIQETVSSYAAGTLQGELQETASGLKYIVHEEGTGPMPQQGRPVSVHYYGVLPDGSMFDNSFGRGAPIQFPIGAGRVIPGWDEGISLLKEGSKATFFIPPALGYGEAGSPPVIPSNTELIFYVELVDVI